MVVLAVCFTVNQRIMFQKIPVVLNKITLIFYFFCASACWHGLSILADSSIAVCFVVQQLRGGDIMDICISLGFLKLLLKHLGIYTTIIWNCKTILQESKFLYPD